VYKKAFTESRRAGSSPTKAYDQKATDFHRRAASKVAPAGNPDMIHLHGLVSDSPQVIAQIASASA